MTGITTNEIRARNNLTIGTWSVRTLRIAGKLEELSYEMSRYPWNNLGLCEVRWKNFGETSSEEGHTSVARRTNTNTALDFLNTRAS